jgi:hypothetical protein
MGAKEIKSEDVERFQLILDGVRGQAFVKE